MEPSDKRPFTVVEPVGERLAKHESACRQRREEFTWNATFDFLRAFRFKSAFNLIGNASFTVVYFNEKRSQETLMIQSTIRRKWPAIVYFLCLFGKLPKTLNSGVFFFMRSLSWFFTMRCEEDDDQRWKSCNVLHECCQRVRTWFSAIFLLEFQCSDEICFVFLLILWWSRRLFVQFGNKDDAAQLISQLTSPIYSISGDKLVMTNFFIILSFHRYSKTKTNQIEWNKKLCLIVYRLNIFLLHCH